MNQKWHIDAVFPVLNCLSVGENILFALRHPAHFQTVLLLVTATVTLTIASLSYKYFEAAFLRLRA